MQRHQTCSFCGYEFEPGTGKTYAKIDGTQMNFCSSKCEKNIKLGRVPIKVKWTAKFRKFRAETLGLGKAQAEKLEKEQAKAHEDTKEEKKK
ncbi:MAG: 50S ribosomal protein L24 [Candidatus Aenigmarchaeota archaeon]|nr:50S ribosomal protein L24 [Candidatus Aenigmarchaeota archaeon]